MAGQKRNKNYDETHQEMIEATVRLIAEVGVEAVSMAALARAMKVNRTTVYYHFESRDELIKAVKGWSSAQLAEAFKSTSTLEARIDYITRFVLENPELIKLWIDDLITGGDIRTCYPHWDAMVAGISADFITTDKGEHVDAEVYSVTLLTSAIIGPRVFKNSVCPEADIDTVVERFRIERLRQLQHISRFTL